MAYKISGTLNESARILVLKESDWSIESNVERSAGDYEIENLVSGTKTIVAIDGNGEVVGYGMVSPEFYGGDRGIFGGGYNNGVTNIIDYIIISTTGNATDFGDLSKERYHFAATSNGSNDRGVFGGGFDHAFDEVNIMDYITISTTGNATDFGDLTNKRYRVAATSNGTNDRGVFGGGMYSSTYYNIIGYITISSIGNAIDFGDLTSAKPVSAATSNGTNNRGVFNKNKKDTIYYNSIDYITISSLGNATDFGDLTNKRAYSAATSNGTNDRGVFGGGYDSNGTNLNTIDYITISTTGNATDFGDLTSARSSLAATSNHANNRGVFGGGGTTIDYITISTTGDATDFGDLTTKRVNLAATSNT